MNSNLGFRLKFKNLYNLLPKSPDQCCGSMTFWAGSGSGSGSADPCLVLMDLDPDADADPDPAIFVIDLPKMQTKN